MYIYMHVFIYVCIYILIIREGFGLSEAFTEESMTVVLRGWGFSAWALGI